MSLQHKPPHRRTRSAVVRTRTERDNSSHSTHHWRHFGGDSVHFPGQPSPAPDIVRGEVCGKVVQDFVSYRWPGTTDIYSPLDRVKIIAELRSTSPVPKFVFTNIFCRRIAQSGILSNGYYRSSWYGNRCTMSNIGAYNRGLVGDICNG